MRGLVIGFLQSFSAAQLDQPCMETLSGDSLKVFLDGSMRCPDNKEPEKATVILVIITW